jgi:hypothetical protein
MASVTVEIVGAIMVFCSVTLILTRRIPYLYFLGLMSISMFMYYIYCYLSRNYGGEIIFGSLSAGYAWLWWKGGGGDGTERRLRKLKEKFAPVRRTASPV